MTRLLKIELHKIIPYRAFWIFISIYFGLVLLSLYGMISLGSSISFGTQSNFPSMMGNVINGGLKNIFLGFPNSFHTVVFIASNLKILLSIIIVTLISNEYNFKTLRQNFIDGLSIEEVFLSKGILIFFIGVGITLILMLVGLIMGLIYSSQVTFLNIFEKVDYLLLFLVQIFVPYYKITLWVNKDKGLLKKIYLQFSRL